LLPLYTSTYNPLAVCREITRKAEFATFAADELADTRKI